MTNNDIIVKLTKKYCELYIDVINSYIEKDIASNYDLGRKQAYSDILEYIETMLYTDILERGDDND